MKIQILPDPNGGHMVCTRSGNVVGARLAHGIIPIPEGPVRRLSMGDAAQMAAKWEAFLIEQDKQKKR